MEKIKIFFCALIIIFINVGNINSQQDTLKQNDSIMVMGPGFFSLSFEATTLLLVGEIGGQIDFDIYGNKDNTIGLGIRAGFEGWGYSGVGGEISKYTSINILGRISNRTKRFWITGSGGMSFMVNNEENLYYDNTGIFPHLEFEMLYNFLDKGIFGIVCKGATNFGKTPGFIGVGIQLGFYNEM